MTSLNVSLTHDPGDGVPSWSFVEPRPPADRDEAIARLMSARRNAISTVRALEAVLVEMGHPVESAIMTRDERRAE